jgi:uncharacterized Zn-finger protein
VTHPTDANDASLGTASEQKEYRVSRDMLPVSCPLPTMKLWNSHPRVYLPIEQTGEATCPYCGAHFLLES